MTSACRGSGYSLRFGLNGSFEGTSSPAVLSRVRCFREEVVYLPYGESRGIVPNVAAPTPSRSSWLNASVIRRGCFVARAELLGCKVPVYRDITQMTSDGIETTWKENVHVCPASFGQHSV